MTLNDLIRKAQALAMQFSTGDIPLDKDIDLDIDPWSGRKIRVFTEPALPSDVDEAAYDWVMDNYGNPKESLFQFDCRCFKAGAKWMVGQGLTQVCRVKADYDSHGADYGVRFLRIEMPDDTPVGEKFIVKIIPKNL